jgi:hypothetical protein
LFTIDATKCAACNYSIPSEFRVTFKHNADASLYDVYEVSTTLKFQVFKILQNPSAVTTFGTSAISFDMRNAFITNMDLVADSDYDWLKSSNLLFTYSGVNNSVMQAISSYNYVTKTFATSASDPAVITLLDFSRVTGTFTLTYTARHPLVTGYTVQATAVSVTV